jgi:NADP-dependent 3-hydroxy acid dehydrogenase YdfG
MISLKDKVVIITGASSGIGQAAAFKFAKAGASVVLAARRIDKLQQIRDQIFPINSNCISVPTDVTSAEQVQNLFHAVLERFKTVDILINNAGRGLKAELTEIETDEFKSVIDTNLTSVFLCTKAAAKIMIDQKIKGHIITVCSIAGFFSAPTYSAYCASKHAVSGFLKSLKWEMRKHNIKISTIHPARVDTEFFNSYHKRPSKRQMLSPGDIADLLLAIAQRAPLKTTAVRASNFFKRAANLVGL